MNQSILLPVIFGTIILSFSAHADTSLLIHPVSCSGVINSFYDLNFGLKLDTTSSNGVLTVTEDLHSRQGYPDVVGLKQLNSSLPDGHYTLVINGNFNCVSNPTAKLPEFYCDALNDLTSLTAVLKNDDSGLETNYSIKEVQLNELSQTQTGVVEVTPVASVITLFLNNDNTGTWLNQTFSFPDGDPDFGCSFIN
jgi:hypothetical protein